jgi:hypothetical protein
MLAACYGSVLQHMLGPLRRGPLVGRVERATGKRGTGGDSVHRSGRRHLGLFALTVAALCLCGLSRTVAELEAIVGTEAVSEISKAAGLALAEHYANTRTPEELADLVKNGRTTGIRVAAKAALEHLNDPLQGLIDFSPEELRGLAATAAASDERLSAARAFYFKTRDDLTAEQLELEALGNDSLELSLAAGEMLAGYYLSFAPKGEEELMKQAVDGASPGLRHAASLALMAILIRTATMTDEEIYARIAEHTLWHPELAEAYMGLLAHRFRHAGDQR